MTFDPHPYAEGIRRLNQAEEKEICAKAAKARAEARRLASEIRARDAEVSAVLLFGSLRRGEPRRLDFDIDLALEGGDLYKALDTVEESPFRVDLVDLRLLPEEMAARIRASGERLA
jgi:predicted nucleotidyltransferase